MSDLSNVLVGLRDVGIHQLPQPGDAGERRIREKLTREIAGTPLRRPGWLKRRVKIGGLGVPVVLLGVVATAAATTGALVANSATSVLRRNPQAELAKRAAAARPVSPGTQPALTTAEDQTVVTGSVHEVASASIPNYGEVQFWGGVSKQGGFCFVLKLPDGDWGGYPESTTPSGGWDGGAVPGCVPTRQQQIVQAGPDGPLAPLPAEYLDNEVKTTTGQVWELFMGYTTAQGQAATVKDPASGVTAPVASDGYFLLAEPPSSGDDSANLEVLDASGQPLSPDYADGKLLPGYALGATPGGASSSS